MSDAKELLALAAETAAAVADFLRTGRDDMPDDVAGGDVGTKSSPTDVVTAMDTAAEAMIVERLLGQRPDDGLLGEEGSDRTGTSGVRWIVDPLDGTVNYLYRLPCWSVSIAAEVDGEVVAGVVHDGPRDIAWTAVAGGGAYRDGRPVRASTETDLRRALLATGFSYVAERRALQGPVIAGLLPRVRDIRRMGSAALDLCSVAAGHVDAYCEQSLHPWDMAAGGLIAREAGCRVAGLRGEPPGFRMTVAAPPALFGALHDLLVGLRADEP
ncbi:MAG TPA: inositol monophosphatase family protein [Mycobacteriales bacterium]|nr:inositol monophosphatase family protein [Mycobacteriales bacterium]